MKAVLVGSDLMYNKAGKLVPIEINTSVGFDTLNRLEVESEVWDLTELLEYIQSKGVQKVYYEGRVGTVVSKLQNQIPGLEIHRLETLEDFNNLEDSNTILAIRTSWSDEALVDSFCSDKVKFVELIKDREYGLEFVYRDADGIHGEITEIVDNGIYPNFIVKYRYPQYNRAEYPALYRFTTIEEVNNFVNTQLEEDFILTPYCYHEKAEHVWEDGNKVLKFYRNWSFFTVDDSGLRSIEVGMYTKSTLVPLDESKITYGEDGKIADECRGMFISKVETYAKGELLAEQTDLIAMADGTWKSVEDVQIGDEVMSLEIPVEEGVNIKLHTGDYNISIEELRAGSEYQTAIVSSKIEANAYIDRVKIIFEDGTDWWDTAASSYMVLDPTDGTVMFQTINKLVQGQVVLLLDVEASKESPVYIEKVVSGIEIERKEAIGYQLSLDGPYIFLSRELSNNLAYASIEHNAGDPVVIFCGSQGEAMNEYTDCTGGTDPTRTCYTTECYMDSVESFKQNMVYESNDCYGTMPVFLSDVCDSQYIDGGGYIVWVPSLPK